MPIDKRSFGFTLFLGALGAVPPLSIDMGLPGLSSIATSLKCSGNEASLTLSLFLAGFAIAPVLCGPLSDRFGRRPILLAGCLLFVFSAIGCTFAPSIAFLLTSRLFQGLGSGAASVLAMALIRDLFEGNEARQRISHMNVLRGLAPMIAPTLGAWLLIFGTWRWIYGTLMIAGILLLLVVYFGFAESAKHERQPLTVEALAANYREVLTHPISFGYAIINALLFGAMFAYVSNSPLLMIKVFGLSNQVFGYLFACTAFCIIIGAFVSGKLSSRNVPHTVPLTVGLITPCAATAVNVFIAHSNYAGPFTLLPGLMVFAFCYGLIAPSTGHGCMHPMPKIAGVASAVLTFSTMIVGALSSAIVALFYDGHSALAMTGVMAAFVFSAALLYFARVGRLESKLKFTP